MIRLWLTTAAVVVSLMAAACTAPQTQEPYTPNDVPIATLLYVDAGHQPFHPI